MAWDHYLTTTERARLSTLIPPSERDDIRIAGTRVVSTVINNPFPVMGLTDELEANVATMIDEDLAGPLIVRRGGENK